MTQKADPFDEAVRLLAILVARGQTLQETVAELDGVGFNQKRIAELLGTTPGYVSVAAGRAKRARTAKKPPSVVEG